MKKKALLILLALVAIAAGGYQLTQALFTDTETSEESTFQAGTLNMTVDGNDGTAFDSITVENLGADGTVDGTKTWTIANTGSLPGNLSFSLENVTNSENGCNEPELVTEPACEDDEIGELGNAVTATVSLDSGSGATQVVSSTLATADQGEYASQWLTNAGTVTVPAGETVTVTMDWSTDPSAYGNEIQSDGLGFDVRFDLEQVNPS